MEEVTVGQVGDYQDMDIAAGMEGMEWILGLLKRKK